MRLFRKNPAPSPPHKRMQSRLADALQGETEYPFRRYRIDAVSDIKDIAIEVEMSRSYRRISYAVEKLMKINRRYKWLVVPKRNMDMAIDAAEGTEVVPKEYENLFRQLKSLGW